MELGAGEKRNIVRKGMGLGSDGELYISKEALEHFKKGEKGANDNIIKPYTGPSTGYKSKIGGKVEIGSEAGYGYKHVTALDTSLLEKTISFSDTQIQKKYKHAQKYFGIKGNYNKGNAGMFKNKLIEHIKNPDTIAIAGKYHVKEVVHYYNPKTNINVSVLMNSVPPVLMKIVPGKRS